MLSSTLLLALALGSYQPTNLQAEKNPYYNRDNEALAVAWMDLRTIPEEERIYYRYIWRTDKTHESLQAASFVWNSFSLSAVIEPWRPVSIVRGEIHLARVDLRINRDLLLVWENFQFEPKFSLLITKDVLKFLEQEPLVRIEQDYLRKVTPYTKDNKTYDHVWAKRVVEVPFSKADMDVLRQLAGHIDPNLFGILVQSTRSQAPVVTIGYLFFRGLSSIKGTGLYKTLYGGLYVEMAGIPKAGKKGTDEDALFEFLGIGNVEAGITAEKIFAKIPSDQRIGIFRSGVTGKPRQVEVLPTLSGRDNKAILSITHDIRRRDVDIGTHPMMNLLKFKDAGREGIFSKANGLNGFVLFNGQGGLVEEVPPDIAADTTIPSPYTLELQFGIGCIRCHASEGGWRILRNDVKTLLAGFLDIFGDKNQQGKPLSATLDRLAGLYGGDMELILLPQARNSYATAVLRATGPWKESKTQTNVVQLVSKKVSDIYADYWYTQINARKAMDELGFPAPEKNEEAVKQLRSILPPAPVVINSIIPEDPRIGALLTGLSINRFEWDAVYAIVANRIHRAKGAR